MDHPQNPYAAPTALVEDTKDLGTSALAGRGIRLAAVILDVIVLGFIFWAPWSLLKGGFFSAIGSFTKWQASNPIVGAIVTATLGFVLFAAVNAYLLHQNGQTIGKRLLKIKIVRTDGENADLARILFFRYFPGYFISVIPIVNLVYPLIDSLLIFRSSRKCLHDNLADTIVIKE